MFVMHELFRLATGEITRPIPIARATNGIATMLGARGTSVFLSPYTLAKQFARHKDIKLENYEHIQYIIDNGVPYEARNKKSVHVLFDATPSMGYQVKITLKVDREGLDIWLIQFHKIRVGDRRKIESRRRRLR